jgi:hypothetical protein
MRLNKTYSEFSVGKLWSDTFHILNGLKQGDALKPFAFQFCFRISHQESPRKSSRFGTEWDTPAVGLR